MDVDAMLAGMTPEQLVEWRAAIDILALDDAWQQAGTICETINNKFAEIQAGLAQKEKIPDDWLRKATDYIPLLRNPDRKPPKQSGMMTPQEFGALMRTMNG